MGLFSVTVYESGTIMLKKKVFIFNFFVHRILIKLNPNK